MSLGRAGDVGLLKVSGNENVSFNQVDTFLPLRRKAPCHAKLVEKRFRE